MLWVLCCCLIGTKGIGQGSVTKGDAVPVLPVKKVLNATASLTSVSDLKDKLTLVDFFVTWCVPCLRALPHLSELQVAYKGDLNILLVSNETEAQLKKFIAARNNFSFPVVVDEDNSWNNHFAPPSLPYTVIIKDGKVLAVTDAASITKENVAQWLEGSAAAFQVNRQETNTISKPTTMPANQQSKNAVVRLSQDYIYAAKTGAPLTELSQNLASLSYEDLKKMLSTDNAKKVFWINLYNGYTQATLSVNPEQYKSRNAFFKKKAINVAGEMLSLDDIEHGILRRSKIKWSLGHLNKLFPSKREKEWRVDSLDYRIHFALNCGAKSCPPIAFYNDETLDTQLDLATKAYLTGEAEYDSAANVIHLPKLMSWFRADFGGKKGMRQLLRRQGVIASDASPKIKFKNYDWTLTLNNYTKQNP